MINESKIDAIKKGKPITIMDIIVMVILLIFSILLVYFVIYSKKGDYLSVVYKGEEKFYNLNQEQIINVGSHFKIQIKNGYAYVVDSDCNNHDCIDYGGKIRYVGQKIVCLPNRIVLKIVSSQNYVDPGWVTT